MVRRDPPKILHNEAHAYCRHLASVEALEAIEALEDSVSKRDLVHAESVSWALEQAWLVVFEAFFVVVEEPADAKARKLSVQSLIDGVTRKRATYSKYRKA